MDEINIVWDEDISHLDYVREIVVYARTRQRPVPWHGEGRRVGYTVLSKEAPNFAEPGESRMFLRRLFFLLEHDRDRDPDGVYSTGAPMEAVDPRTVRPNVKGQLTERAWERPFRTL